MKLRVALSLWQEVLLVFFFSYDLNVKGDPTISRLFKYFYMERRLKAKYFSFWPVEDILDHLSAFHSIDNLSLKDFALKTLSLSLIALTSSDRGQTIHSMTVNSYVENDDNITFVIFDHLKHTIRVQKSKEVICVSCDIPSVNVFLLCKGLN